MNTGMNTTRWIGRTRDYAAALVMIVVLVSCEDVQLAALGQLQSERVELVAESGEPIIALAVTAGRSSPGRRLSVIARLGAGGPSLTNAGCSCFSLKGFRRRTDLGC